MNKLIRKYSSITNKSVQDYFIYTTFSILGYNKQQRNNALQLQNNSIKVIIGIDDDKIYNKAIEDGFKPDINLFSIKEASKNSNIIINTINDKIIWNKSIYPYLTKNKTLCFLDGFNIMFNKQIGLIFPSNIDIIMISQKNKNSNVAVYQDISDFAEQNGKYIAYALGSETYKKTTIKDEVYNKLVNISF